MSADRFDATPPPAPEPRVAYVLKMFPRFSETFILTELLAHEAAGHRPRVVSLRHPNDGRFHAELADVRADVTYLDRGRLRSSALWDRLAAASEVRPIADHLDELLATDVRDVAQALDLAEFVRRRRIDHLHAHFGSVATTVARLAARLAGVTYSFTAHAKDIFHESVDPADLRAKLADARHVVTISQHNLDHLRATYGPAAERVSLVRNGLALPRFPHRPPSTRATNHPPVIAAIGRLVEKKGFADLVAAVEVLVAAGRDVDCRIMGGGALADELAAQVSRRGLQDHVSLLGPRPQDEVRELLAAADVFAAPCVVAADDNRDGLPTVVLEAMALGTPCVATPVTGIPEVVEHDRTGLLVEPRDPVGLAGALARLLDDRDLAERLSHRARARVERDHDAARQAAGMWQRITAHLPAATSAMPDDDAKAGGADARRDAEAA